METDAQVHVQLNLDTFVQALIMKHASYLVGMGQKHFRRDVMILI